MLVVLGATSNSMYILCKTRGLPNLYAVPTMLLHMKYSATLINASHGMEPGTSIFVVRLTVSRMVLKVAYSNR